MDKKMFKEMKSGSEGGSANPQSLVPNHDVAIKIDNLSKKYRLYDSPQQRLKESFHPFRKKYHRDFWALRDISVEIKKGETIGIIGRNGSGKSTLLQIICGTLTPTTGNVEVLGKIAALLELGAGFNPEFTGRDNIYMKTSIMGLSREEVNARLGDILSFADIGDFIDQPVKTYSSGMYVRLAFSVSINVDPDILIIDEALAVGDEAFRRKCFSRLMDLQTKGRTILFVSHAASTVVELCNRAILLDQGEMLLSGSPKPVVSKYHKLIYASPERVEDLREEFRSSQDKETEVESPDSKDSKGKLKKHAPKITERSSFYDAGLVPKSTINYESRGALILNPMITTLSGERVNVLARGQEYIYTYTVNFEKAAYNVRFGMLIKTITGLELGGMASHPPDNAIGHVEKSFTLRPQFRFKCALLPGVYFLNAGVLGTESSSEVYLHRIIDAMMFRVQPEQHLLGTGIVDFSMQGNSPEVDNLGIKTYTSNHE